MMGPFGKGGCVSILERIPCFKLSILQKIENMGEGKLDFLSEKNTK